MPVNLTIQAPGRWIWGNPLVPQIKMNRNVNPPVPAIDANGNKIDQWSFGVAFTKQDFNTLIWPALEWEAKSIYPQGMPQDFAWKVKDGDTGLDQNNKPLRDKEGYAGHMVLAISTESFAPKVVQLIQGIYQQIVAGQTMMKCGDYFRLALNIVGHGKKPGTQSKPGLYLNPSLVEWIGVGKEIFQGPDPMATFGGQQFTALPQGVSMPGMPPQGGMGGPGGFNPNNPQGGGGNFQPNNGGNPQGGGGFPGSNAGPGFNPNGGGNPGQNFTQPPQQPNGGNMNPGSNFNPNGGNQGGGFATGAGQGQMNPAGPGNNNMGTASPSNFQPDYGFANGGNPNQQGGGGNFQPQQNNAGPQGFNPNGGPGGFPGSR